MTHLLLHSRSKNDRLSRRFPVLYPPSVSLSDDLVVFEFVLVPCILLWTHHKEDGNLMTGITCAVRYARRPNSVACSLMCCEVPGALKGTGEVSPKVITKDEHLSLVSPAVAGKPSTSQMLGIDDGTDQRFPRR